MAQIGDIKTFEGLKTYSFTKDTFTVRDLNGNDHVMLVSENFTNKLKFFEKSWWHAAYEAVVYHGGNPDDQTELWIQAIFPPPEFPGKVRIEYFDMELDHPRILASIDQELFNARLIGKEAANLTPLQEMMYHDILEITRKYLKDEDNSHKNLKKYRSRRNRLSYEMRCGIRDNEDGLYDLLKELEDMLTINDPEEKHRKYGKHPCDMIKEKRRILDEKIEKFEKYKHGRLEELREIDDQIASEIRSTVCDYDYNLHHRIAKYIKKVMDDAMYSLTERRAKWKEEHGEGNHGVTLMSKTSLESPQSN